MNKPPAFQFYAKDWRSSATVRNMTLAETGVYIQLLAAAWDGDEPGTLPLGPGQIAKITGIDVRIVRRFLAKFPEIHSESAGKLHIKFLREQYVEIQQRRQAQSDAAKALNEKRWGKTSVSDSVSGRSAPASPSASAKEDSLAHAVISRRTEPETAGASPSRAQLEKEFRKTAAHLDPFDASGDQRAHLEAGIFRKRIEAAYFDATNARMKPDDCIQEAISAAALSLVGNRSVELRGLSEKELANQTWERIRNSLAALHEVQNFETRSKQVVAVVTRTVTRVALEFLERGPDVKTVATG